jgi:acyl-CoA thioesterase-1
MPPAFRPPSAVATSRARRPSGYGPWRGAVNLGAAAALALATAAAAPGPARAAPPDLRILAFGDSLTAGYGLPEPDAFAGRLQAALAAHGIRATVINGGVSGDTTAGGLSRLDWALGDRPSLVILELGANDALRGIDPAVARANLDAMLAKLRDAHVPVLLAGMLAPPNLGAGYAAAFNPIYPELAAKYRVPLYPFFLDGVARDPALNQPDGLHPNAAGVAVIVGRLLPVLIKTIEALPPRSSANG